MTSGTKLSHFRRIFLPILSYIVSIGSGTKNTFFSYFTEIASDLWLLEQRAIFTDLYF